MLGFLLSILLGAVFFYLIQTSVQNGMKAGITIAGGVILSDILLISLAIFANQLLPEIRKGEMIIAGAGGVLLIIFGILIITKGNPHLMYPSTPAGSFIYYGSTGFVLNTLNPINLFYWFSISTYLTQVDGYALREQILFFGSAIAAIFGTETFICFIAIRLKQYLNSRVLWWINMVAGGSLLLLGGRLIWMMAAG